MTLSVIAGFSCLETQVPQVDPLHPLAFAVLNNKKIKLNRSK